MDKIDKNKKTVQAVICTTNDLSPSRRKNGKGSRDLGIDIKAYVSGKDRLRELEQLEC